ncbi:hypothetical protein [Pseudomonas sp. NA-150]|uniref:hypothetical protein n=1 Tax=Pseudomonas sp. NA-150 TaxID=3367525 RepID=UPI0037C57F1C
MQEPKKATRFSISGDWGGAKPKITKELINIVFDIVEELFGKKLNYPVLITNFPLSENPIACYAMKEGCYQVNLSASSGLSWCQIVYQLAHELCHLNSNYSDSIGHKYKWLEESLCEMCSIAVLIALSKRWNKTAMYRYDRGYSASVKKYIESLPSMIGYMPKNRGAYLVWFDSNVGRLESSCDNRELNGVVANYLYKNVFSIHPTAWNCVGMLNKWNCHQNLNFTSYKESWREQCNDSMEVNTVLNAM